MIKSDQWIMIFLSACIALYLLALAAGLMLHKLPLFAALLNLLTSLSIAGYWIQRLASLHNQPVYFEATALLCFEILVAALALYTIIGGHWANWQKLLHYIIFGIHFSALILFIFFMLTFKMNRLI